MALRLVLMVFPRVLLVVLYLSASFVQRDYGGLLMPLLGLIFLPATATVYAWIANSQAQLSGSYLAALVIALLIDMGAWSEVTRPKPKPRGMVAKPEPPLD